ncbi:MAG: hypothetical protein C0467_21990 [Planctomycetaceae bacterium]|nr:hypothetical protein [Planctomycetaceae bacterium]
MTTTVNEKSYRRALDTIATNCGATAKDLLTAGHSYLTPEVVISIAKTSPERQQVEMERVGRGEKPLKQKVDVFDTTGYGEIGSRIPRAYGKVNKLSQAVARFAKRLTDDDRVADAAINRFLSASGQLFKAVRRHYQIRPANEPDLAPAFNFKPWRDWSGSSDDEVRVPKVARGLTCGIAFMEKCVRDLRRLPDMPADRQFWPSRLQAHSILVQIFEMIRTLLRTQEMLAGRPATPRIVTHSKPDGDAVAAAWLAERFWYEGRSPEITFVTYDHNWALGSPADCVIDMGGLYAPSLGLFDHKQPAFADRHDSCATRLLWEYLIKSGRPVRHLESLVNVVHAGDSAGARSRFKDEFAESKRAGFHMALKDAKAEHTSDADVYRAMCVWLDRHHKKIVSSAG